MFVGIVANVLKRCNWFIRLERSISVIIHTQTHRLITPQGKSWENPTLLFFFFVFGINDCQHVLIDWNNVLSAKRTLHEKVEAGKSDI